MVRVRGTFVALVAVLAALPVGPAAAGTVFVQGETLVVQGTPGVDDLALGRVNDVSEVNGEPVRIFDVRDEDFRPLTPGAGCAQDDFAYEVTCRFAEADPAYPKRFEMEGGAGNDQLDGNRFQPFPGVLLGGAGDDQLGGGGGADTLDGGEGNDELHGDDPSDGSVENREKAPDILAGGPGTDTVSYSGHQATSIVASIDGRADDGQPGEGDNVGLDVENLTGEFSVSNTLTGSDGANELRGGSGADALLGGGGNDRLFTFGGNDSLDGEAGDDFLEAGFDDDTLEGGPGLDSFVADRTQTDTIGTGNDTISARDGVAEPISCGPGADRATVDASDTLSADGQNLCETVDRGAPPTGGGGGGGSGGGGSGGGGGGGTQPAAFPLTISGSALRVSKAGRVSLRLTCNATDAAGCNGDLRLASAKKVRVGGKQRTLSLGSRPFSIDPGKSARVTFKLSRKNRTALRRLRKVRMTLTATERAATPRVVRKAVTLRR